MGLFNFEVRINMQRLFYSFIFLCLLQEIYPPKLAEFAYVTDGACSEEEILEQELVILKVGIDDLFTNVQIGMQCSTLAGLQIVCP